MRRVGKVQKFRRLISREGLNVSRANSVMLLSGRLMGEKRFVLEREETKLSIAFMKRRLGMRLFE